MGERRVNPVNGRYTIPGRNNRNLELTIDDIDLNKYIVEELDDDDMRRKIPASASRRINWFSCFSIYKNKDGHKDGYANVKYSFTVDMSGIQELYIAYDDQVHDVTEEMKNNGKVSRNVGDPPVGSYP